MRSRPCCCRSASQGSRAGEIAGGILSSLTLVLLPKCPACVAAWVALATGIGISLPAASTLRWLLLAVSISVLALLATRWTLRLREGRH